MRIPKLNKVVHKWLSLIVGLQLLIWLGTGLYFNLMDSSLASGNEYRVRVDQSVFSYQVPVDAQFTNVDGNNSEHNTKDRYENNNPNNGPILLPITNINSPSPQQVQLLWILQRPYYYFVFDKGAHSYQKRDAALFDAITGRSFTFTPAQIKKIAVASYSGPGHLKEAKLVTPPFEDYIAQQNPMWRVDVEDSNSTSIYLDSVTGRVLRHANDDSRLQALMFKLHFMDYGNSGGFNHWLIVLFAVVTLLLSTTGIIWLYELYKKGLLKLKFRKRAK